MKNDISSTILSLFVHKLSADFAACMEDVLEVYSRPYDERYPVVCMYEMATFLHYSTGTFGSHGKNQC